MRSLDLQWLLRDFDLLRIGRAWLRSCPGHSLRCATSKDPRFFGRRNSDEFRWIPCSWWDTASKIHQDPINYISYMIIYDHWWSLMIIVDDHWWSYMIIDDHWWPLMIIDDHWWSLMIIDDHWWSLILDEPMMSLCHLCPPLFRQNQRYLLLGLNTSLVGHGAILQGTGDSYS